VKCSRKNFFSHPDHFFPLALRYKFYQSAVGAAMLMYCGWQRHATAEKNLYIFAEYHHD